MSATFRTIYPENRIVSVEWVLSQGFDAKVNAAVDEHVKANGVFENDEAGDRAFSAFVAKIAAPDVEESIALLEDLGLVTFAKFDPDSTPSPSHGREDDWQDDGSEIDR